MEYQTVSVSEWRREREEAALDLVAVKVAKSRASLTPEQRADRAKARKLAAVNAFKANADKVGNKYVARDVLIPAGVQENALCEHEYGHASRPYMYKNARLAAERQPRYRSEREYQADMVKQAKAEKASREQSEQDLARAAVKAARQALKTRGN